MQFIARHGKGLLWLVKEILIISLLGLVVLYLLGVIQPAPAPQDDSPEHKDHYDYA